MKPARSLIVNADDYGLTAGVSRGILDSHHRGIVTSTTFSQHLGKSLAMAQIAPSHTALGTAVEINDGGKVLNAHVVRMPFYDPLRFRTHPASER